MIQCAIAYSLALAELAYAHSLVPNKARREKAEFDARVQAVRARLTPLAVTEQQQDVLEANMVVFQRVYAANVVEVLRSYIKTDGFPRTPGPPCTSCTSWYYSDT